MQIEVLESTVSDNFFYLVHDQGVGVLIDPIDAKTAIAAVESTGVKLAWVVNTHFHPDHTGGNDAVFARFQDAKLCAGPDHELIGGTRSVDHVVTDGEVWTVGELAFDVLETPGHTAGHVALRAGDHLFSGDTIFVGGAGHCRFGGDPGALYRTFRDVLASLPDDIVFYPGHDYARRNIEFALSIEPDRAATRAMLARVDAHDSRPFLASLGMERAYNPFFRAHEPALREALQGGHGALFDEQRALSEDDDEATFRTVRALRNTW